MSEAAGENGTIRFTVKELLAKVDVKLDAISGKLDAKADAHDVHALDARVGALEKEAAEVRIVAEALSSDKKNRFSKTEKVVGTAYLLATLALNVLALAPDLIG
jgi:hypothetical protein